MSSKAARTEACTMGFSSVNVTFNKYQIPVYLFEPRANEPSGQIAKQ
jgi:hypothetical protein